MPAPIGEPRESRSSLPAAFSRALWACQDRPRRKASGLGDNAADPGEAHGPGPAVAGKPPARAGDCVRGRRGCCRRRQQRRRAGWAAGRRSVAGAALAGWGEKAHGTGVRRCCTTLCHLLSVVPHVQVAPAAAAAALLFTRGAKTTTGIVGAWAPPLARAARRRRELPPAVAAQRREAFRTACRALYKGWAAGAQGPTSRSC